MQYWAVRQTLEGDELEDNRRYNLSPIHGEPIHQDRFRYYHVIMDGKETLRYSCGGKYDPDDVSGCPFCMGARYNRTKAEVLDLAKGTFGYPPTYDLALSIKKWKNQYKDKIKSEGASGSNSVKSN